MPVTLLIRSAHTAVRARRLVAGARRPSWDDRTETVASLMRQSARLSLRLPLEVQRRSMERMAGARPGEASRAVTREPVVLAGVRCEWARPPGGRADAVIVYLHGGGYAMGSIVTHRDVYARVAVATGVPVLGVEYRLAPEHRFPAQLEDALAVYRALLDQGYDPARIALVGESAGGHLTLSTLLALRDLGLPLPAAGAALSGWFDLEARGQSFERNADADYVQRHALLLYAERFVGSGGDRRRPLAAPIHGDFRGLPPLLLQAGGAETLRDDTLAVGERARAAGVDTTVEIWPDMFHAWQLFAGALPTGARALDAVSAFLAGRLA